MKINDIINEDTSAGSIAVVSKPMGKTIKRKPPVDEMGVGGVAMVMNPAPKKKKKTTNKKTKS